jgi:mono/diheme cytochrome c family protein
MKRVLIGIVSVFVLAAFAGLASAQDHAKGMKVYADQKCSMCHSIAGKGAAKGPLDGVGSKLKPEEIREWIVDPAKMTAAAKATRKPAMPAKYKALPKEDLDALVDYLSSLKAAK